MSVATKTTAPVAPEPAPIAQHIDEKEVERLVGDAIAATVGESEFQHANLSLWTNRIIEDCIKQLVALGQTVKFVVSVTLGQKAGAGMHVTSATVWDAGTDGKIGVHWTNAAGVIVLAVVYWVAV